MPLHYDFTGTTDAQDPKWESIIHDRNVLKHFKKISVPVYHTDTFYHEDMGYDHKGRRAPCCNEIDLWIWTVIDDMPSICRYYINVCGNYIHLDATFTDPVRIRRLTVDPYDEYQEETFSPIYDLMCSMLGLPLTTGITPQEDEESLMAEEDVEEENDVPIQSLLSAYFNTSNSTACNCKKGRCKGHNGWIYPSR